MMPCFIICTGSALLGSSASQTHRLKAAFSRGGSVWLSVRFMNNALSSCERLAADAFPSARTALAFTHTVLTLFMTRSGSDITPSLKNNRESLESSGYLTFLLCPFLSRPIILSLSLSVTHKHTEETMGRKPPQ
ncbi:hypothetical protein DNTS_030168 [Danionella cerebrum]|uniref:Uncharacterized protein n=1 Tax=Danionella cerebrum TaxID=2873325 RepID=A0A553Q820_9TELE|nr:hypothetical protein DNTS_030168 [Danionella translucida]